MPDPSSLQGGMSGGIPEGNGIPEGGGTSEGMGIPERMGIPDGAGILERTGTAEGGRACIPEEWVGFWYVYPDIGPGIPTPSTDT